MDIDVGSKAVVKVRHDGQTHEMRLPSVDEVEVFQEELKKEGAKEHAVFCDLVAKLGFPHEVAKGFDIRQFKKFTTGLLGIAEKK